MDVPRDEYERIGEEIASEESPVGIHAKKIHIIVHKLTAVPCRIEWAQRGPRHDEGGPRWAQGRALVKGFISSLVLAVFACGGEAARSVTVEIVEPADRAVVSGPDVRVVLAATGVEITSAAEEREGTAHHHLFVDRGLTSPDDTIPSGVTGIRHLGRGQSEFVLLGLAPGEHTVIALLGNWAHVPLRPLAADTVRFTVRP